jgi:hypothetical protein
MFDVDLASMCCIFIPHDSVCGKARHDRLHIVRVAGVDVALNDRR